MLRGKRLDNYPVLAIKSKIAAGVVDSFTWTLFMTAIDLSSYAGLTAMVLLTINILLGLLISVRYSPVRSWPHRRIPVFDIHNWTAYIALGLVGMHPSILLFSSASKFKWFDILWPLGSPGQRLYNCFGACAFYLLLVVAITSYLRRRIGRPLWKLLHYLAYGVAAFVYVHGTLIDPNLKNLPTDFLDGEKVLVETCGLVVVVATIARIRYGRSKAATRARSLEPSTPGF
jgi:DMSO/TMAO reductase YedYZ heme-binding membrane subunit